MKILLCPHNFYPFASAGGEAYLNNLCQYLINAGHEVKAIVYYPEKYTYQNIECYPQGDMQQLWINNNDLFRWCDVVFTQLLGTAYAYNKCKQHNKCMVFFAHNTAKCYTIKQDALVVYNAHETKRVTQFPNDSFVLQPLVSNPVVSGGSKIALINCNTNKGGLQFISLAEQLPYNFIGYKGMYGDQICDEPVTYYENGTIDWSEIRLLLVLSETESWSMAAQEAMFAGIPVIATPLPGIKENLSFAGIYIERDDTLAWCEAINELMTNEKSYEYTSGRCIERSKELDPDSRFIEFNTWLVNKIE